MNSSATLFVHIFIGMTLILLAGCTDNNGLKVNLIVSGEVTKVHDGDSIHITPQGKRRTIVRLAAIDAPEINQTHGVDSRNHLRSMILQKQVTAHCNKVDKYKRQICVVLKDNRDVNLEMLKTGNAWYYEKFREEQNRKDQRIYRKAEENARKKRRGIWIEATAIPPWEFRDLARN